MTPESANRAAEMKKRIGESTERIKVDQTSILPRIFAFNITQEIKKNVTPGMSSQQIINLAEETGAFKRFNRKLNFGEEVKNTLKRRILDIVVESVVSIRSQHVQNAVEHQKNSSKEAEWRIKHMHPGVESELTATKNRITFADNLKTATDKVKKTNMFKIVMVDLRKGPKEAEMEAIKLAEELLNGAKKRQNNRH
jgi:hypothetical protein